jgi:non-specific protein-tyrosine kinase
LTTVMLSQETGAALPLLGTSIPGLRVLPAGALPPNPADILSSQKMQQLLEQLKADADAVILDAPPVTVAVDAAALAARTDGLLLVVRAGHTRRDRIAQAQEMLERFRVRLLGVVFTDAPGGGLLTGY